MSSREFQLYTASYCGYCRAALGMLAERGFEVVNHDVTRDQAERQRLATETGRSTVPQIWHGDTYVGGYDDLVRYLAALDEQGADS